LRNQLADKTNDIVILDALDMGKGPLAVLHLPFKLRMGLHGNFVDHRDIKRWQERRSEHGDLGPARPAEGLMAWQVEEMKANGVHGTNGTTGANGANGTY